MQVDSTVAYAHERVVKACADAFQLQSVHIALTELDQPFGWPALLPGKGPDRLGELDVESVLRAIEDFSTLGDCPEYTLAGGDVMLRPGKLWRIVDHLRRNEFASTILVVTDGTLVTESDARAFARYRVDVQIRLDGSGPSVYDTTCSRGAFEGSIRAIQMLLDHGVYTSMCVTALKPDLHDLEQIVGRALDMGIDHVQFQPYHVCDGKRVRSCDMGVYLYVISGGDLYPCAGLMCSSMLLGNVCAGFSSQQWQSHPTLHMLRTLAVDDLPGRAHCDAEYVCRGGSWVC